MLKFLTIDQVVEFPSFDNFEPDIKIDIPTSKISGSMVINQVVDSIEELVGSESEDENENK